MTNVWFNESVNLNLNEGRQLVRISYELRNIQYMSEIKNLDRKTPPSWWRITNKI